MKKLKIVSLLVVGLLSLFLCFIDCKFNSNSSLVPKAISQIVFQHFSKVGDIHVVQFGNKTVEGAEVIRELMSHNNESIALQLKEDEVALTNQSLLIFASNHDFLKFFNSITYQPKLYSRIQHLLYIIGNDTVKDVLKTVRYGFYIDELNFLTNITDQSIDLITTYMHTKHECRKLQVVTSNQFKRSTMAWDHNDFYPNKYRNMFGCPIIIATRDSKNPRNEDSVDPTASLAESLNASTEYIEFDRYHFHLIDNTFDLMRSTFPLHVVYEYKYMKLSHFVAFNEMSIVIPPGELYTPIEKMFLPFDAELWVAIAVTLTTGLVVIKILNRTSLQIQNFCYGRNIRTPTINMISIVLNGAQFKVPFRNFSRFIFVLFVWWSLIMRTCYQSELFKYLQADPRRPPLTSIEAMEESGFCIHTGSDFDFPRSGKPIYQSSSCLELIRAPHLEGIERRKHILNYYFNIVAEPANKFALCAQKDAIDRIHHSLYRSGFSSLNVMKNYAVIHGAGYALKMLSPFNGMFNDIVLRSFEAGLFLKEYKDFIFKNGLKKQLYEAIEPQILTMEHLEIGFKLCFILLCLACFIFALECSVQAFKNWCVTTFNKVVSLLVVLAYMDNKIIHI